MDAIQIFAILGYVFLYIGYFIRLSENEKPYRSPIYETLSILIIWNQLSVGWAIFMIVWSGFWFLIDLVRVAQEKT
jgi:hypothetical protein